MACNLARTSCAQCGYPKVKLEEKPRPIRRKEAGRWYKTYDGLLVAKAHCPVCGTLYLAWVDETTIRETLTFSIARRGPVSHGYIDLSYRSSFGDEPGKEDILFLVDVHQADNPVVSRLPAPEADPNTHVVLIQATKVVILRPFQS